MYREYSSAKDNGHRKVQIIVSVRMPKASEPFGYQGYLLTKDSDNNEVQILFSKGQSEQ